MSARQTGLWRRLGCAAAYLILCGFTLSPLLWVSVPRLVDYPNMWGYARELHQWPGVARAVAMAQIKEHYYTTHDELNPKRIIPVGPAYDWSEPHGRA